MNKKSFTSQKYFEKEKLFFLKNSFFLVGHICEFKKIGDFKTLELFGKSIVIYNFSKKLSAFTNVCVHRGSKIFTEKSGNSMFKCPYHAWTYDETGHPKFIPFENKITHITSLKTQLKLENWDIEFCGKLIFIKSKFNKKSLNEYLGKDFQKLSDISQNFDERVDLQVFNWKANWKICIENSIDEYHAVFLHETTFKNTLSLNPIYTGAKNVFNMSTPLSNNYLKKLEKLDSFFKGLNNNYTHNYIFPMSSISTTGYNSFYIQSYLPINSSQTQIVSTIYMPKTKKNMNKNVKNFFFKSCIDFNNTVFFEDKIICENIHNNIRNNNFKKDFIGKLEYRINIFRKILKNKVY